MWTTSRWRINISYRAVGRWGLQVWTILGMASVSWAEPLVLNTFEDDTSRNSLGHDYGAWNRYPEDDTQGCTSRLVPGGALGAPGQALRLDYDVTSPNPAYNGFWTKLGGVDLQPYQQVVVFLKGDAEAGYTTHVKIELKSEQEIGRYLLGGITDQWQRFAIPMERFEGLHDRSRITEFVLVFDDMTATKKTGTLYLDDIAFE